MTVRNGGRGDAPGPLTGQVARTSVLVRGFSAREIAEQIGAIPPGSDDQAFINYLRGMDDTLLRSNNLSDLPNAVVARSNLGLGNVDNTSDLNKPISTATQAAIDSLSSSTTTGLAGKQPLDTDLTLIAELSTQPYGRSVLTTTGPAGLGVQVAHITDFASEVDARLTLHTGMANGLAPLGADNKIDAIYLPDSIVGAVKYQGTWNASTNTPAIPAAASGNKGSYYKVATAGTTSISGINDWGIGDWIISNGSSWDKIDNTDSVVSVANLTGAVSGPSLKTALAFNSSDVTTALGYTPLASGGNIGAATATSLAASGNVTASRLLGPNGSAAAPSLGFFTANNGFFNQGTGQFGVSINGSFVAGFYDGGLFVAGGKRISTNGGSDYIISTTTNELDIVAAGVVNIRAKGSQTEMRLPLFLSNQGPPPTPTGGGVLYVEGGALKYKGSSGSVTTLGPA